MSHFVVIRPGAERRLERISVARLSEVTLHYGNESWTRDMRSRQSKKFHRMGMSPPVLVHHIPLRWLASMVIRRVTGYIGAATLLLACTSLLSACAQVGASPQRRTVTSGETSTSTSELVVTARPSTGCGKVPPVAAGTTAKESLKVLGLTREYRLHLPAGYEPSRPLPLVLAFHGHGNSAAVFERVTGFSKVADAQSFIVVYPQGAVGPDHRTGWNTSRPKDPKVNDRLFISELLNTLQSQLCVNPKRIYATGFSNGGGFTAVLACDFSARIAAFASVSGEYYPQPGGCEPARPVPLLEIHGTDDGTVPYEGSNRLGYPSVSQWLEQWAARNHCSPAPRVFYHQGLVTGSEWTACAENASVIHYTIVGGRHIWPGSTLRRPLPPPDQQLNATSVIWSFFAGHSLP